MSAQNRVEVINRDGWRNEYPINKKFVYIGTDPRNDIVLNTSYGSGIESRHLQVIWGLGNQGYRLVNLANSEIPLSGGTQVLQPLSFRDVTDQTEILLGDFRLIFHAQGGTTAYERGETSGGSTPTGPIDIQISLPQTELKVNEPIEGKLLVRHLGGEPGVQFKLEVIDFPAECYTLGAAPYLFPYGEEDVPLKLMHSQKPVPKGGDYPIRIRATAPEVYPGKSAEASKMIKIAPFFNFSLDLKQSG